MATRFLLIICLMAICPISSLSHDSCATIVDLSHLLNNKTLHWPLNNGFQYFPDVDGIQIGSKSSYYLKSDSFTTAVHSGTHLDAPRHFSSSSWTVEKIPLKRLIDVPAIVIDVSNKVKSNRSYNVVKDDFFNQASHASLIKAKSVVLIYTGISEHYDKGPKEYFGTDTKEIEKMKIPGLSKEAAKYLVDQEVYGVGLDSPSADSSERHKSGGSYDPQAHEVLNSANVFILENISNSLKKLIDKPQVRLIIAPLSIEEGSGSPVRLIATYGPSCGSLHSNSTGTGLFKATLPATLIFSLLIAASLTVSFGFKSHQY